MAEGASDGLFSRIGRGITRLRNFTFNTLFLLLLLIFVLALLSDDTPRVPEDSALLVNPRGVVVDERSLTDPLARLLAPEAPGEIELRALTRALTEAAGDQRIRLAVLDLDETVLGTGQAAIIGEAIRTFQAAGKEVIAYGAGFGQSQYLLASYADAVYMHPMGQLILPGFGSNRLYFKGLLDKLDVNMHIFRAGKYKEFVEPYTRPDMSDEAREANQDLVDELWTFYAELVMGNRSLEPGIFERFTQSLPEQLGRTGDLATTAVEHLLVDELLSPDEARTRIANEVGYAKDGGFKRIGFQDYLAAIGPEPASAGAPTVAIITAEGPILMGWQSQGVVAADTVISLIRKARQNEDVRALVLRVNSPGGSAFASELIRQELELLQLAGKPVVVSMSSVAASGGYWISATADRIFAQPTTLTGSIGVFGMLPTFEASLARIGITTDGVGTTPLSGALDPFAGLSPEMATILQLSTERTYEQFVNLVARGREMDPETVDDVAQGRVWTGTKAHSLGLVDELGGLQDAIHQAAELAELSDYRVQRLRPTPSPRELLLSSLEGIRAGSALPRGIRQAIFQAESLLKLLNDPRHSYALCEICFGPAALRP